ncbi:histidine kinase [bacterium]|nr:MAG: histidine kinase [bacterium]
MNDVRPSPQDFLELVRRAREGKLRVYIGFAAGVGKTYRLLQEAHALAGKGADIVIAAVDAHDRPDTEALIPGLEVVPLRTVEYRGLILKEMDLEGVLARRPAIAIVDEVAHTNAPGSKNVKRYKDILELLEAGISVLCAFNVQHLESLNDLVEQETGVKVLETIPDTFLDRADQIVNVDLPVEDLLERLKAGKIYPHERVPLALEGFFRGQSLLSLRELTLREVAESIETAGRHFRLGETGPSRPTGPGRVMVCLSSMTKRGAMLLRKGSRVAGRLNTHWFVVNVETPSESPVRIKSEAQRYLIDNFQRAEDLGAEVVKLKGKDPVKTLLKFARENQVSDLVVGRSRKPWLMQVLGLSPTHRLVNEALGFDVHVVAMEKRETGE